MTTNTNSNHEGINPSLDGRESRDPYVQFLNRILVVVPYSGRSFAARLIDITKDEFVFVGATGRRSIYRRDYIRSVIEVPEKEAVHERR